MENNVLMRGYLKKDSPLIQKLWNDEVGHIYPLTREILSQKVNNCIYTDFNNSYVAFDNGELVGFIISKIYDDNPIILKYTHKGWISLFYVKRTYSKKGIGKSLLEKVEREMKTKGVETISIGSDMDNFFPGIPHDFDNLSDIFFRNRGYNVGNSTHDLIKRLTKQELVNFNFFLNESGLLLKYNIRYASKEDESILLEFLKKSFYGRWYSEAFDYFKNGEIKKEYLIITIKENTNQDNSEKVIGFLRVNNQLIKTISYNIIWAKRFRKLVGYGPLGVDSNYRKQGLAKLLILYALNDSYQNGYSHALIDWTGLVSYYQKFGFEVWKCYRYAYKDI